MAEHDCSTCFICRCYEHVKKCWPDAAAELQEPQTRWLIHRGLDDAKDNGFISERDVAKFIDLGIALGRDWPDDKRFVSIQALLRDRSTTPEKRMGRLYKEAEKLLRDAGASSEGAEKLGFGHKYRIPPTSLQQEAARRAAARLFKTSPGAIELEDVSGDYMWARGSPLFRAVDAKKQRLLVGVTADARIFNFPEPGDIQKNLVELNGFLAAQKVRPLWALPPLVHAKMIRHFLMGASGFLASWEFLNGQRSVMAQWTLNCPADGPALFEECSRDPQARYEPNKWALDFNYFNRKGGVEKWHSAGNQDMVLEAEMTPLVPDGKFNYPYG